MRHGQRFNAYSHLLGLVLVVLYAILLLAGARRHDGAALAGIVAFALSSALLFLVSTVFHSTHGGMQRVWQRLDHGAIFLLIAGSYTPFALAAPREPGNLLVLALVWCVALGAFAWHLRGPAGAAPSPVLYAVLGWAGVAAAAPAAWRLSALGLVWLLGGALLYSLGIRFYRNRSGWAHAHGVWHLFVVAGTSSHFAAVYCVMA